MYRNFEEVIGQGKKGFVKACIGALVMGAGARLLMDGFGAWAYGKGVDLASKKWFKVVEILGVTPEELLEACRKANSHFSK